ncbi:MAG TPA: Eco57I restriction-modification methylase domain-containing protein [Pirellulales bacterium]|nr:Eco57I restriction-modification methylase domain-containing protein [Pirellulales bacterium]
MFSPTENAEIERWWVGEKTLANVLRQLVFAQPRARARARQQLIATDETIDYGTLEVRQLGDIYEGLLGGKLERQQDGRLQLLNERGANQREGIFYTPDWIVRYLVRETLQPLLDQIDASSEVQVARRARSSEKQNNNSFAHAVLRLNVVDPAMGSGHFLVRATEFLGEKIFEHPTTRRMTEQILSYGKSTRSRQQILADGRIPVSPGLSQEQAEMAYWRRRVVEACIYGVDTNPLAVELAKLSLWLTCISVDEPLSFLDHHLHRGNSLLGAHPDELRRLPFLSVDQANEGTFEIGDRLTETMAAVIKENVDIEAHASTEMEVVKNKERRWREVREKLKPFLDVADAWFAALDGLPIDHISYRNFGLATIDPKSATADQKADAEKVRFSLAERLLSSKEALQPFHWRLEFPDVFFQEDGKPLAPSRSGFDVVLGNPPYVSTHTSAEQGWRGALERRAGYLEDTYVHFTELGFSLLREGGAIGFIVSDTFFTLATKSRMREWLQQYRLTHLGQCDPFDATVDAAIFVACKQSMADEDTLLFVQARNKTEASQPEHELPKVKPVSEIEYHQEPDEIGVRHGEQRCLRLHSVPIGVYRGAIGKVFFEPSKPVLELYRRFNRPVQRLLDDWWERIDSSDRFDRNLPAIQKYDATLKPGDVTLVGLVAAGGQGLATANNARFLGYLEGTPQARDIERLRNRWTQAWLGNPRIRDEFLKMLAENGGDPKRPTQNTAAWEACVEPLKGKFGAKRDLGIRKTDLYHVFPLELLASERDYTFAWKQRKAELLHLWQREPALDDFWSEAELIHAGKGRRVLRRAKDVPDELFCDLCQELLSWWEQENERRKTKRPRRPTIPRHVLGLRSSESYRDVEDAPRVATVYNGLSGRAQWVPFRKGDPEGHRWLDDDPLHIQWTELNVDWLFTNSGRHEAHMPVMRNPHLYLTEGICWTRGANHVAVKTRLQPKCVFDANGLRLTPINDKVISPAGFLAVLNSAVFSFFLKKFVDHTWMVQISDIRMMPFVVPSRAEARILDDLAERAMETMRLRFQGDPPPNKLVASVRNLAAKLAGSAPGYLRPPAQQLLLATADDCLAIIELAVNWEAEKLYGVEGLGPFDEF